MAASPATTSSVLSAVLLVALAASGAGAANVVVVNNCSFTVWPAAIPVGGGVQLNPGQPWEFAVPTGTAGMRVWARTGCVFDYAERGGCVTGDCASELCCKLPGKPPATLAEFSVGTEDAGDVDYYDVSVVDGFNLPMDFASSTGDTIRCRDPDCADASHPGAARVLHCSGNNDYQVTFCP
jgi:hypothetical protein